MTIESYVTAADVIVDNPTEPEVPEQGKLTFVDNWIKGQIATVNYNDIAACELMIDNTAVATITNSGTVNVLVTYAAGEHSLKCGQI